MLLLAIITSFLLTFSTLPIIIRLFKTINLTDSPDKRKIHKISTPSLGGLAIYFSILLAVCITLPLGELIEQKYFLAGLAITLILGVRDDIASLNADQKLMVQFLAAFIAVYYGGIAITSMHGIFGIHEIPLLVGVPISVIFIVGISNAFNLIDGIDGLAASVAIFVSSLFGYIFIVSDLIFFGIISLSLTAAMMAFLFFNWEPSKIFMGDTGSLVTGFLVSCLSIVLISFGHISIALVGIELTSLIGLISAILILPIYDTFRVFIIRILAGRSPFSADSNHLHHILIKQGFSHGQSVLILIAFNIFCTIVALLLQGIGDVFLIVIIGVFAGMFGFMWDRRLKSWEKRKEESTSENSMIISKSA